MPLAYTLTNADYLSNNKLLSGVVDNIITESQVLEHIKFKPMNNKALVYNRELTNPTAAMTARDGTLSSSSITFTQVTRGLGQMYSQVEVSKFDIATKSDTNDPEAIAVAKASKSVGRLWERKFIYGNDSTYSTDFDGLHALVSTSSPDMTINVGSDATPAGLQIEDMYDLINLIRPGRPDFLLMNRTMRKRLSLWAQGTTSNLFYESIAEGLGKTVMFFDGIPIVISDYIVNTETISGAAFSAETGGASTSIFAVKLGEENDGLVGLDAAGGMHVDTIPVMENKDNVLKRVVWYTALALYGAYSLGAIVGIDYTTAVAI